MLSDVIARFSKHATLTVTRAAAPTLVNGVWVAGSTSTVTLTKPSVQPVTGDLLRAMPEGHVVENTRVIFTVTELRSSAGHPDTVVIDGDVFAVFKVEGPWQIGASTSYRVWAEKQTTP